MDQVAYAHYHLADRMQPLISDSHILLVLSRLKLQIVETLHDAPRQLAYASSAII